MVITHGCLHLPNVNNLLLGERGSVRDGESEREREREIFRLLTAQSGFLMKMEDKCLFFFNCATREGNCNYS